MSEWRVLIAKTADGTIQADVEPSAYPGFSRVLNDVGSFSIATRVDAPENASIDFHSYVSAQYSWVVAYNGYIVQAGPVWSYAFDDATRTLTVNGAGIGSVFTRRITRNPSGVSLTGTNAIVDPSQNSTYTNLSLRAIISNLVNDNMAQQFGALPITVSNLTESGTNTVTYNGYDLKNVTDNMTALSNQTNGPEWDFAPQFVTSNQAQIQWVLNVGNPTLGNQVSSGVWDYGGSLTTIDLDVNASASPVSRVWTKGSGSGISMLSGYAQNLTQASNGYPLLDYVDSNHSSSTVQSDLNGWASADLSAYAAPFETWTCAVRIDGALTDFFGNGAKVAPGLGDFALGDAPTFFVDGHPWIKTGAYRRRIMGFSSNDPWTVALQLYQTLSFN